MRPCAALHGLFQGRLFTNLWTSLTDGSTCCLLLLVLTAAGLALLTSAELAELWAGPLGVEQRAIRLLCLAAAAGDLEELQVCDPFHKGFDHRYSGNVWQCVQCHESAT